MSRIEQLIEELCPEGVEWKSVGEVCDTITDFVAAGSFADLAKNVTYNKNEDYAQLIRTTDIKSNFSNNNFIYVSKDAFNYLWRVNLDKETIILPNVGNCGEVYFLTPKDLPYKNNVLGPNAILVRSNKCNNKFLSYLFASNDFQITLKKITSPSGQTKFNKTELKRLTIPIPPLPIQQEIINILDKFTALDASLQAELEARRKQYEHYRNQLLNFEGKEVEWRTLGEIANFRNGKGHEKEIVENGRYIVVNSKFVSTEGKVVKYANNQICPLFIDDILIVMSDLPNGKALAKCFIVSKNNTYTLNQRIGGLSVKNKSDVLPKYLFYILNRNMQLLKYDNGTDQTNLRKDDILDIQIPVPPLSEQERIVGILDKFDAMVSSTGSATGGLPAEIDARRKQYEYYREKLLTFEPK